MISTKQAGANGIGFPDRSSDLDVWPGFQYPPAGYGEVPFFWWIGDPLTKERLSWQMDQLDRCRGIMGLQINYAHGYKDGGISFGLTIPSEPPLFSDEWWRLLDWFQGEAKRRGWAISLSDYTLGIGQGWCVDDLLKEHPELTGYVLQHETREAGSGSVEWNLPRDLLMVSAYPLDQDGFISGAAVDLRPNISGGVLRWHAPGPRHRLAAVSAKRVTPSLDPMHPLSGTLYAEYFFGRFEKRFPGEAGKGLNFFFSDELGFGVDGDLWTPRFAEEFCRRKGYDLVPELPALFMDCGPRTPKIRLDYRDVMVALEEEGFFKPVFDWHQKRGMIYGCDHGGRGKNVLEFGDYFRTQRWNQGPGCDQPCLEADLVKNKVASSIAHLYLRPRVWLEGYHSSGWGTSPAQLTEATITNFAQGQNLLSLHGLYYATHGGFWEWAPPCNHFRMPYWEHMSEYMMLVQRISYLMSQGYHRCDTAIIYPVAPMEAGMGGRESVDLAFDAGRELYAHGIDFDFMDFESLDRADIEGKELCISGERFRVLILPAMRAVRWSTLQKALKFQEAGGVVIVLGAAPEASDRIGRDDAELNGLVSRLVTRFDRPSSAVEFITRSFPRDFAVLAPSGVSSDFMHRKIGARDVYMIHRAPKNSECWFRATGKVELWDPWTGTARPLPVLEQTEQGTRLQLPLSETEAQIIVFSGGKPQVAVVATAAEYSTRMTLDGDWEFELRPTLDNRFGDFRWPPTSSLIGPEAIRFRYADEVVPCECWESPDYDDSKWPMVTSSFGPQFWKLGPLPEDVVLDEKLAELTAVDPSVPVEYKGMKYSWRPYEFSWRWGVEGNPGPQGYHGLKEKVSDDFILLGTCKRERWDAKEEFPAESCGSRYYLWTAVVSGHDGEALFQSGGNLPQSVWLNGKRMADVSRPVVVKAGANPLLLRYDQPGRGHFVLLAPGHEQPCQTPGALAMQWYRHARVMQFDCQPGQSRPAGWYRFSAPPGLRKMIVPAFGRIQAWVDGDPVKGQDVSGIWHFNLGKPVQSEAKVALRIEQCRGRYGGAALPEPVRLECGAGIRAVGDWSRSDVLENYSGGAWYRKTVILTQAQIGGKVILDIGNVVASAEIHLNGRLVGVRIAPPWQFDISHHVKLGENRIEILVYNALSNHYMSIPTGYRGTLTSGLIGPVAIIATGHHAFSRNE